ncbi:Up-regulated during septation-domain-containing protein [Apodospora peruviana]|uniref:Up-regulated during septation-domain-containing protein n=1 Tax=Apodospora peruviana TaxID=516989 RepID=A0AAE0HXI6_9PEZI|nr:Up-regulated during septation-domain-containing protein [Apodospora peruviana]
MLAPAQPIGPNGKTLVEGYRQDIINGFDKERPRYNPLNAERPQSSALVDLADPIQVHLLTETALSDSKTYEILSQEEVDDLKKQIQSLSMRIEQAKANLAIQSKYRDAAISMAKLYSSGRPESKRRSLLGNNRLSDQQKEAEMERQTSERRCEELAAELFSLEKRLMGPQKRLLQHTAGILQMTHRASSKNAGQPSAGQQMPNGIPGSPESLYTSSNARNSMEPPGDDMFDDRSLYLALDQMDGQPAGRPRKNTIEIPMKSPVREQAQLRGEVDRVKEENSRLKEAEERLNTQNMEQQRIISDTEKKLERLNRRLRDVIITFNPGENAGFPQPGLATGPGDSLGRQLEYLEMGLLAAAEEQKYNASESLKETEAVARAAAATESLTQAEGQVQALKRQVQDVLQQLNLDEPRPAESEPLGDQLDYLGDAIQIIQGELSRAADLSSSASTRKQNNEQVEAVLTGLWDIIQTGYAEIQQQKAARKKSRSERGLPPDEDDMSSDEMAVDVNEMYSLQAFSARVQWLYAQATSLKEQKSVLKRQIKQQRELNSKSDAEKDQEMKSKTEELEKTRALLDGSERTAREAQEKLADALDNLDMLQKTSAANESASVRAVEDQLKERNAKIATLETQLTDLSEKLAASEANVETRYKDAQAQLSAAEANSASMQAQLSKTDEARAAAEASVDELQKNIKNKEEEIEQMNMMVIELKTEVTIAKAELDGAYGSRAQRAAEAAALSKSSESSELNQQVTQLKAELESTLKDFEEMTKESIASEKEKLDLETKLDDALSAQQRLESEAKMLRDRLDREVGELREQLDAEKLKVPPSPRGGGVGASRAGASMLSEQFRTTMKEERKKFQEELREEQAKRRKLEDELRAMKRNQPGGGIGRSPLGPLSPSTPR